MGQQPGKGVFIAVIVFVALAIAIKVFGGSVFNAFLAMHGRGGGAH